MKNISKVIKLSLLTIAAGITFSCSDDDNASTPNSRTTPIADICFGKC